jgi:SET domain-containing protein
MEKDDLLVKALLFISLAQYMLLFVHGFASSSKKRGSTRIPRPIIPTTSFSHKSALQDGIDILPAPDGKGMGAFSNIAISKGDVVGEYTGEILTRREVEARYWGLRKANKHDRKWRNSRKRRDQGLSGDYIFDMGNDSFIDGEDADCSSWCRFANHADPNHDGTTGNACNVEARVRVEYLADEGNKNTKLGRVKNLQEIKHLYFIALVDIKQGSELCYDYGEEYWDGGGSFH